MKYEISKDLVEKIGNYLALRPWVEVNAILIELQQLKEIVKDLCD